MRIYPDKLAAQLRRELLPLYLISGDEPLQHRECCDAVRAAARASGCAVREVIDIESDGDWGALGEAGASLSLFAERRLIELRLPSGKPGRVGAEALRAYCARPAEDAVLLIASTKIERAATRSAWYRALDGGGAVVAVWPLAGRELHSWIEGRLRQARLRPERGAAALIAERVEGNLLAAQQEIDKLALLYPGGTPSRAQVQEAVVDSSRYSVFDLSAAVLAGEPERVWHILSVLRGEGVELPPLLWALHRELREMAIAADAVACGAAPPQALGEAGVAPFRQAAMAAALRRHRPARWRALSARCASLDLLAKGRAPGDCWLALAEVSLAAAGHPLALAPERVSQIPSMAGGRYNAS